MVLVSQHAPFGMSLKKLAKSAANNEAGLVIGGCFDVPRRHDAWARDSITSGDGGPRSAGSQVKVFRKPYQWAHGFGVASGSWAAGGHMRCLLTGGCSGPDPRLRRRLRGRQQRCAGPSAEPRRYMVWK